VPSGCPVTDAELDALRWLAEGKTPRLIAESLDITAGAVTNRLRHARERLGVLTNADAITALCDSGWLPPDIAPLTPPCYRTALLESYVIVRSAHMRAGEAAHDMAVNDLLHIVREDALSPPCTWVGSHPKHEGAVKERGRVGESPGRWLCEAHHAVVLGERAKRTRAAA
jgi:DNA-binding CsgD family transcriptional regulator